MLTRGSDVSDACESEGASGASFSDTTDDEFASVDFFCS